MSEVVNEESMNSESKKKGEDIPGENAAPISSILANNDVTQPKTSRAPMDVWPSPNDGPVQLCFVSWYYNAVVCTLETVLSQNHTINRRFVVEWYKKYP